MITILEAWEKYCEPCKVVVAKNHKHCPQCGSPPSAHEMRNYNMMWHDGDIHCVLCGTYVRSWDAG